MVGAAADTVTAGTATLTIGTSLTAGQIAGVQSAINNLMTFALGGNVFTPPATAVIGDLNYELTNAAGGIKHPVKEAAGANGVLETGTGFELIGLKTGNQLLADVG